MSPGIGQSVGRYVLSDWGIKVLVGRRQSTVEMINSAHKMDALNMLGTTADTLENEVNVCGWVCLLWRGSSWPEVVITRECVR